MTTSSGSGVAPAKFVPIANGASTVFRRLLVGCAGAALAVSATLAWLIVVQRRVVVRGQSMRPLLRDGERVLVDRFAYRIGQPRRGDVALVQNTAVDGPDLLLKRIVGLPGETIAVERDLLWIDGEPLDFGRPVVGSSPGHWTLAHDTYFLLSENLAIGTDSRHTGPVRRAALLGRAWLVYAPNVRRVGSLAPLTPRPPRPHAGEGEAC